MSRSEGSSAESTQEPRDREVQGPCVDRRAMTHERTEEDRTALMHHKHRGPSERGSTISTKMPRAFSTGVEKTLLNLHGTTKTLGSPKHLEKTTELESSRFLISDLSKQQGAGENQDRTGVWAMDQDREPRSRPVHTQSTRVRPGCEIGTNGGGRTACPLAEE